MCDSVPVARDIPPFVMYCIYGEFGSSLTYRVYGLYDIEGRSIFVELVVDVISVCGQ